MYKYNSSESNWYQVPSSSNLNLSELLNNYDNIQLPEGVIYLYEELIIPRNNIRIRGAGKTQTIIRCHESMKFGHALMLIGKNDCSFEDFILDCNAEARELNVNSGYNGFNVQGLRNCWSRIQVRNAPRFGILIDGNTIPSYENEVQNCDILNNGGTGVAINKSSHNKIVNNFFYGQGWENLTLDVQCFGNLATKNSFFEAQQNGGGCGNIGWDDSDGSIFSNNFIDSGRPATVSDPAQPNGNIIGLCINSEAGVTTGAIIEGNIIVNHRDCGIHLRNRTGETNNNNIPNWNPSKPGDAIISGNYIRNSGYADIRIGDTDQIINISSNNYLTLVVDDPDSSNVRISSGDSAAELEMSSNQSVPVQQFTKVLYTTVNASRRIDISNGTVSLKCGGFYSVDAKFRYDAQSSGITAVQMRIVTPSGNKVVNEFLPPGETVGEISASITKLMSKGDIYVEIYPFGGSGNINLLSGSENWLSVISIG